MVMALALCGAAAEAAPCGGKFAAADEMLDTAFARYGTLYAGGSDEIWGQAISGMGADIDLWRLWNGLPDLGFRDADRFDPMQDWGGNYSHFGRQAQDLNWLLHVAAREGDRPMPLVARYMVARYLNALIGAGPYPGWWLDPGIGGGFLLADAARAEAKPGSLMEWLLVIQAQSDRPDAVDWGDGRHRWIGHNNIVWTANWQLDRLLQAGAGLAWKAADAPLISPGTTPNPDCLETPAAHALRAVRAWGELSAAPLGADLDLLDQMPAGMRRQAMEHLAQAALSCGPACGTERLAALAQRAPDTRFAAWLSVGRSLQAGSVEALLAVQTPGSADWELPAILNTLSLDGLTTFQAKAILPGDLRQKLWKVIAARAFVLGRLTEARAALSHLGQTWPAIGAALSGPGDEAVRVARALMVTPGITSWVTNFGDWGGPEAWRQFDLPRGTQTGAELEQVLGAWVRSGSAGFALWRAKDRGRSAEPIYAPVFSVTGRDVDDRPIARLVAFDELGHFGRCNGLLFNLNAVLIPWARDQSAWWRFADREQVAATLAQLLRMNRLRQGVTLDGRSAAQQAFGLLQGPYAQTEAAKAVRYWHFEDIGCKG